MPRRTKLFLQKVATLVVSVFLLIALLVGVAYYQGGISFEDVNLETAVREKIGNSFGYISRSHLLQITHLDVSGYKVTSLEGMENLTRLVSLNLEDNSVEDLRPLKNLTKLTELNLRNNGITDLTAVHFNAITSLPLRKLSLRHNHIEDISPLGSLTSLNNLDLRENRIKDISPLKGLTGLTYLNLHSNFDITSVEPLANLVNLETLILRNVPVGDGIDALRGMTALRRLNLRNCYLTNTEALARLMENGFLQDQPADGIVIDIDLRENKFSYKNNFNIYDSIELYWGNVGKRLPFSLPKQGETLNRINVSDMNGTIDIKIAIEEHDLDNLYGRSGERFAADVYFRSEELHKVSCEIRLRGGSARNLPKKSFDFLFTGGINPLFNGSTNLNLNAMYTDPSLMREYLAFGMYHHLKRPAPRTAYSNVWINGLYEGLYIMVEQVDGFFLQNSGMNPNGTLVRDQLRSARHRYEFIDQTSAFGFDISLIEDENRRSFLFDIFNNRGNTNWVKLEELLLWVSKADPGEDFADSFAERFDVDIFIDWLALHYLIGDIDSWGNDYFLYLDHEDPDAKWIVIPWDKDLSFGSHWRTGYGVANDHFYYQYPITGGWSNELLELFLTTELLQTKLFERLEELMKTFNIEYFENHVEYFLSNIVPNITKLAEERDSFKRNQFNHHSDQADYLLHKEVLLDFIELRYAYLDRIINPIEGIAYEAETVITNSSVGDTILLTDYRGWTVAKIKLLSAPNMDGKITIKMFHNPDIDGIDKKWSLQSSTSKFNAELTLYYRNETEESFSKENWVTRGNEPVGEQNNLVIAYSDGSVIESFKDGYVNPYSNKVVTNVTITPEGPNDYVITFVD